MLQANIMGRLGADPETRATQTGKKVTSFNVACNQYVGGEDVTVWVRVTIWGEHPLIPHLKKGSAVFVSGQLKKPDIWTDKSGQARVTLEITAKDIQFVSVGGRQEQGASSQGAPQQQQQAPAYAAAAPAPSETATGQGSAPLPSNDDDLPF